MTTPAERYAAAKRRAADARTELHAFAASYGFELDDFQIRACKALESGDTVLVAAPTGSGKTVVGEFGVHLAIAEGRKCFYTTPIKALSNQKYHDLIARYGAQNVGLLTGDNTINGEAPIVVMTTEVLRNMLYAGSGTLSGLSYVVMDEVHYLADRFRGAVWEEVIIHLPESVRVIALSATVSNAEEFGDWLGDVRGQTTVVVEERRPVPLWQHVMTSDRIYDLFVDEGVINPELIQLAREDHRNDRLGDRRPQRGGRRPRSRLEPSRVDEVERLDRESLLPAIVFIFSRVGCDAAVVQCLRAGLRLTDRAQREEIRRIIEMRCAEIPEEDLGVLGYDEWADALERGIAAHHAGMLPTFKEVVEELFTLGLVQVVFATETLALGINMPARSVVLERLVKWNGDAHVDVTAGEYTQLTGRAGRRGIDIEGHAVVAWHHGVDPQVLAGLASTRTYPLNSSFKPSYNMAVNLVGQVGRPAAREMLETSFAQFQADRAVVGLARQMRKHEETLAGYRESMTCHLGDFEEYSGLRRKLSDREAELAREGTSQRRAQAASAMEGLRIGDIIMIPAGRRAGLAVVLDPGINAGLEGPRPTVLTAERQVRRLTVLDFPVAVKVIDSMRIPKSFNPRNPQSRRDLASSLRTKVPHLPDQERRKKGGLAHDDEEIARLRRELRQHPCHGCDERENHARWAERYWKMLRENQQLERRINSRTNTISRTFDRVCALLEALDYLEGETVTEAGRQLGRLYNELDLVAAECMREGLWDNLNPAQLASCVSALVYESRRSDDDVPPRVPQGVVTDRLASMVKLWADLDALEKENNLSFLREPDLGFAWASFQWTSGRRLETVLQDTDMTPGDFVRAIKQLMDLLGQVAKASGHESPLGSTANAAIDAMRRGVVSYSGVS